MSFRPSGDRRWGSFPGSSVAGRGNALVSQWLSRDDVLDDGFAEMAIVIQVSSTDHHLSLGSALSSDRLWLCRMSL